MNAARKTDDKRRSKGIFRAGDESGNDFVNIHAVDCPACNTGKKERACEVIERPTHARDANDGRDKGSQKYQERDLLPQRHGLAAHLKIAKSTIVEAFDHGFLGVLFHLVGIAQYINLHNYVEDNEQYETEAKARKHGKLRHFIRDADRIDARW